MKHLIIVKFKENVWVRESEASRKMLADIRHDLMLEMDMDQEELPVYYASATHQEWKARYGKYIQTKTIFDYE